MRPCRDCGAPIPEPDLELEAQAIDRALGIEAGRLIDRRAWAAGPPDGLLENILGWLPAVQSRHALWRRGQQLWADRMAPERWGTCGPCTTPAPPVDPA